MSNVWAKHKTANPDYIKNNPGVSQCEGLFTRTINGNTKRFRCQLRYDHDGDCLNYSGRKSWPKGKKIVKWDQMQLPKMDDPSNMSIGQAVSEAVSKALSLDD